MRYIIIILLVLTGYIANAQLPASTFNSRWFTGNTRIGWTIADSPYVNFVGSSLFNARYAGTQMVFIGGGDTAFYFGAGGNLWFRTLLARDTLSLSNRINLKVNISDTALMLLPYLRKADTTNKWVQDVYVRNDSLFKFKNGAETFLDTLGNGGGGASGTVTSVGLSLPSAFNVTPSSITTSGTFAVTGAGTALDYIRGNGTLAVTDTGMIPNFHLKVRSLLSGASPITFNQTTGLIGINNANTSGTKGAASFNSASFSDNGSGLISLTTPVTAGSCTNCNITFSADGRATVYANGTGPGGVAVDTIWRTEGVDSIYFTVNGTQYAIKDSTGNINISNASLTANGNYSQNWSENQWFVDSIGTQFLFRMGGVGNTGTRRKEFRINWGGSSFGDNLDGFNLMASIQKADLSADSLRLGLISSGTGVLSMGGYDVANPVNNTFISYGMPLGLINISARDSIWMKGAVPAATADSILGVVFRSPGVSKIVKIPILAAGSPVTLNNIGGGYRWLATPSGDYKTVFTSNTIVWDSTSNANGLTPKVDTSEIATQYDLIQATPALTATQIAYGGPGNTMTSEAAFNYIAATNKLSVDSVDSKKINTDSLRIVKSPSLADDTLLTRKSNGNVGKVWNIGVNHLNNGTNAIRNNVWSGNGRWEPTGVHTFFKVDESNFPASGDSIYTNASLAGYQHYNIYREGVLQYMDTIDGVEIDTATGTITWHPPLVANERVQINADKLQPLRGQPFVQFDVNSVPNVRAWFDATDATTITIGTGVSQWDDKTSNNNNITNAVGADQPSYFSSGGSGNQAFLRFNSTDALFHSFSTPDSAAITIYMVTKQTAYTNGTVWYGFGVPAGWAGMYPSNNGDLSSPPIYWGYSNYDGTGQNEANLNTGYGDWQVVKAVFRGANANYVTKNKEGSMHYINSPEGIGAGSPTTLKNESILFTYGYDQFDMSEAVIIKGEPNPTDDINIKSYLMSKYQILPRPVLLMFGDSHTYGLASGTPYGRGYFLTTAKDKGYDVMNNGISSSVAYPVGCCGGITGQNLSDLYNQFDSYLPLNDVYVAFQYGTNDGTSPTNPAWVASYKASIQHFLDLGVPASKIIICTPPYTTNPTYATNVANAVPIIQGIATDLGIQYCDFYTYLQGLGLDCYTVPSGDLIHMNLTMHNACADLLKTFIP